MLCEPIIALRHWVEPEVARHELDALTYLAEVPHATEHAIRYPLAYTSDLRFLDTPRRHRRTAGRTSWLLDIVIAAEAEVVDFTKSDAQIGIRYDATSQSGLASAVLGHDELTPVCTPGYATSPAKSHFKPSLHHRVGTVT